MRATRRAHRAAALLVLAAVLAAAPARAASRLAVLPFRGAQGTAQMAWLESSLHTYLSLLVSAQTSWEPVPAADCARIGSLWGPADSSPSEEARRQLGALGAGAALIGTFQAQSGALRLQADLYLPPESPAPLHFAVSGKAGQVAETAAALAELAGEALEKRFLRILRPPLASPPQFLLSGLELSFGPRSLFENFSQTESFLLTALKIDPNNADAYSQLGSLYARNGQTEKALANLRTAVELSPKTPRYHYLLGLAHTLLGQQEEALTEFLQSTVIDEAYLDGLLGLGALHRAMGDRSASQSALERASRAKPEDPQVLVALGVDACLGRDFEGARRFFTKTLEVDPKNGAAYVNLALLDWEQGNPDGARKSLERALAGDPGDPEALTDMAIVEGSRGSYDEAVKRLQNALDLGGPRRTVLYNLGTLQMQAGRAEEAAQTFQRVLDLDPGSLPARNNLALIRLLQGDLAGSATVLGAVREDAPEAALLSYNLGLLHQLQKNQQAALVQYLRALQIRRDLTPAHINLGILFEGMGRPEKALTEYLKALSSADMAPEVYSYLGLIYSQRGYGSMAEETIRKTTLVAPTLPIGYYYLALSLERTNKAQAAASWQQFLEAVARDRNRAFWAQYAKERLTALGSPP